jgi:hypothetical protein
MSLRETFLEMTFEFLKPQALAIFARSTPLAVCVACMPVSP